MSCEVHVRFSEGPRVKFPRPTQPKNPDVLQLAKWEPFWGAFVHRIIVCNYSRRMLKYENISIQRRYQESQNCLCLGKYRDTPDYLEGEQNE